MRISHVLAAGVSLAVLVSNLAIAEQRVIFRATPQTYTDPGSQLSFTARTGLVVGQQAMSDPAAYSGPATTATVSNGELRVCTSSDCSDMAGGGWSASGSVVSGRYVQVRRPGPTAPGQTVAATVTVGQVAAVFSATSGSSAPTLAAYADTVAIAGNTISSELSLFTGQIGATVTVSNGQYRICKAGSTCTAFTAGAGSVDDGDSIQLTTFAPSASSSSKIVGITAGTATQSWKVTTPKDVTPDAFSFTSVTGVDKDVYSTSGIVALSGHDGIPVSISGHASAQYQICATATCTDNGTWKSTATDTVGANSWLRVRVMPNAFDQTAAATLTAGTATVDYSARSRSLDTTPDPITFADATPANAGVAVLSDIVRVTGHEGITLSVSGTGAGTQYRVCNISDCSVAGAWTSASSVLPPDTTAVRYVQLQTTSGASATAVTTTLVAGTLSTTWTVTTASGTPISGMGIANQALRDSLTSALGTGGWTLCGSGTASAIPTFTSNCNNATRMLLIVTAGGVEFGTYFNAPIKLTAPYGGWINTKGFYFTSAGGRGAARYDMSGYNGGTNNMSMQYYIAGSGYFAPLVFEMEPTRLLVHRSNGAWTPGFGLDGQTASTPGYVIYNNYTFKAYKQ